MSETKTAAPVAAQNFVPADQFDLSGGSLHVSYSTTGFDGKPHLDYRDSVRVVNFRGDQITITPVPGLGDVVTVTLVLTVDSGSTTFSLFVPRVQVRATGETVPVCTDGVTTQHRFSIVPRLNHGQLDLYSVTRLRGTASFVVF